MTIVVLFKSESAGPDKYVELLEMNDFNVKSINCLSFKFTNSELLLEKLRKAEDYEGIIFTSPRAVYGVEKAVDGQSNILREWITKRNYSVGETTSELCQKLLNLETEGKQSGNANQLSSLIIKNHKDNISSLKPFLFPSGNLKQDTIERSLETSGINVTPVEIYETIEHPQMEDRILDLMKSKVDFIVYFSPSGIKYSLPFLRKHQINLPNIKFVAIGPSTKKYLEENELKCYRMCKSPTPESLLEVLSN